MKIPSSQVMRTNILEGLVSFPKTILESGIREHATLETKKTILRLNMFLSFAVGVSLISLTFNMLNQLYVSAIVNLGGTLLITVAFFLNKDGHFEYSKKLGILTIKIGRASCR